MTNCAFYSTAAVVVVVDEEHVVRPPFLEFFVSFWDLVFDVPVGHCQEIAHVLDEAFAERAVTALPPPHVDVLFPLHHLASCVVHHQHEDVHWNKNYCVPKPVDTHDEHADAWDTLADERSQFASPAEQAPELSEHEAKVETLGNQEQEKEQVVSLPNTGTDPWAVVIPAEDAPTAVAAVYGAERPVQVAMLTVTGLIMLLADWHLGLIDKAGAAAGKRVRDTCKKEEDRKSKERRTVSTVVLELDISANQHHTRENKNVEEQPEQTNARKH